MYICIYGYIHSIHSSSLNDDEADQPPREDARSRVTLARHAKEQKVQPPWLLKSYPLASTNFVNGPLDGLGQRFLNFDTR